MLTSPVSDTTKEKGYAPARFGENTLALSPLDQLEVRMPRDKLLATGNVCEFVNVPGGLHNFTNGLPEWREKTRTMVAEFLKKQGVLPVNGSQK